MRCLGVELQSFAYDYLEYLFEQHFGLDIKIGNLFVASSSDIYRSCGREPLDLLREALVDFGNREIMSDLLFPELRSTTLTYQLVNLALLQLIYMAA